jgi:hypothetical protein
MAAGNIFAADVARQRRADSQAMICRCCAALNLRGSTCTAMPAAEAARPTSPSTIAVTVSQERSLLRPAGGDSGAAGPGAGSAGPELWPPGAICTGMLPSPGFSGCMATPECYGLC